LGLPEEPVRNKFKFHVFNPCLREVSTNNHPSMNFGRLSIRG